MTMFPEPGACPFALICCLADVTWECLDFFDVVGAVGLRCSYGFLGSHYPVSVMLLTAFTWPFFPTTPNFLKLNKNTSNGILSFVFNLAPACSFGSEERISVCTRMQSLPLQSF